MRIERLLILGLLGFSAACTSGTGDDTETGTNGETTGSPTGTTGVEPTTGEPETSTMTTDGTITGAGETTVGESTVGETTVGETTAGESTVGEMTAGESTVGESTVGETTTAETTGGDFVDELAEGCGFPRPCEEVVLRCGNDWWNEDCTEPFSKETQCALERLAAGEALALRFNLNGINGEVEWYDIVFDGKGGAIRQDWLEDPGTFEAAPEGPTEQCVVAPTDDFAGCLALPNDDPAHAACMLVYNWFTSCEPAAAPMCPAP